MAEAHLNGSLNLASPENVFRTVSAIAGSSVARLPDGETGERLGWIEALVPKLRQSPQLEEGERSHGYKSQPIFAVRDGISSDEIELPELGYSAPARESYAVFRRLRDDGVILPGTRFQVSLPTVTAGCEPFIQPEDQDTFEPAYARRLKQEVGEILDVVPVGDLALQWDVAVEMGIAEGLFPAHFDDPLRGVTQRLAQLASWVPAEIPLGYHLCYGDAQETTGVGEGRHWKEPENTAMLVQVANAVTAGADRKIDWFSMPVPIARDDDAYFEQLADLSTGEARIYLGLVHHQDGASGTQRRIDAARRHLDEFGVATECGMGRKPTELVTKLLEIQRDVTV